MSQSFRPSLGSKLLYAPPVPHLQDPCPIAIVSILGSALRRASPRRALSADQHWKPEAVATRAACGGSGSSENQRTRPERRLGRDQRSAAPPGSTLCARDCQDRAD